MNIKPKEIDLHTFDGGLNSDSAPELVPPNQARYMLNCRSYSFGQKGVITNVKGNVMVTMTLPAGANIAHGYGTDEENNKFYFLVFNSNLYHTWYMYNSLQNKVVVLLQNLTDTNGVDIFKLNKDYPVYHVDIIDNNKIAWVDGWTKARKFNIAKALDKSPKGYGFIIKEDFITAYKKTSIFAPVGTYFTDITRNSNFLYGKLFKFAQRFIYDDGEKSNWSDYSGVPLPPNQSFTGLNTITYDNNCILLQIETGNQLVVKIEIAMMVGSLPFVTTAILDKAALQIPDDSNYTFNFYNDGADVATDQAKIIRPYSFLPDNPACQAFVKNAITYSKFYEGFESLVPNLTVAISYDDLFIPSGTANQLNTPTFICSEVVDDFDNGIFKSRHNVTTRFEIGHDVKKGNIFTLTGVNGGGDNYRWTYKATAADTAQTVANQFKNYLRAIGRGMPDGNNGISTEAIDGSGNVSWYYKYLGKWKEGKIVFNGSVTPISFQSLKDNGVSVQLVKPGSTRKYAVQYFNDDGKTSNGYSCDAAVVRTGFITETGENKRAVHTISLSSQPPIWARHYQLLRTDDSGPFIQLLIQNIIPVNPDPTSGTSSQEYLDLVVGSLFTYQKLHPNTIIVYDFAKGDRLRPIKWYSSDGLTTTLYPYFETEILSYSINTDELINEKVTIDGSDTVVIDGIANPEFIGKSIVINNYERIIISTPAGNKYQVDKPIAGGTVANPLSYSDFRLIDRRGILRIKKPTNVVLNDLSLVELYKPLLNDMVGGYKEFKAFGMKFDIANYGTAQRAHIGNVANQYAASSTAPAVIQVTDGDAYIRSRELPTNNSVPGTQFFVGNIIDPNFSDYYESDLKNTGRVVPQDDGSGRKYFGSRTRFSNNFIQDTKVNGLNDFDNLDRMDYNDPYGDIMLTKFIEDRMYFFKFLRTAWTGVSRTILNDGNGQELVGTSSKLLGQLKYYSREGGIGNNPESYVRFGNYQYYASTSVGEFLRLAGDGLDPISSIYNYDKESREILNTVARLGLKIPGGCDRENKEVIWTVAQYNDYIFKSNFITPEWNVYNDPMPDGATPQIVAQPANSVVAINGSGLFNITAGNVLGSDFFTYRFALPGGGFSPTRKECFTVVEPSNRVTGWRIRDSSLYCVKVKNCSVNIHIVEQSNPYSDANLLYKVNGVEVARLKGSGDYSYTAIAGDSLSFIAFSEQPSTGANPTKKLQVWKDSVITIYGPVTNSNNPGDPDLTFVTTAQADTVYDARVDSNATAFPADAIGILVVDIFDQPTLNAVGFIDTAAAITPYQQPAYTGVNFIPNDGTPAQNCWVLASDQQAGSAPKWRWEFNIAQLMSLYPAQTSFVMKIKGRAGAAGTVSGQYNLKGADAGKMIMTGSPGTYIPSTSATTNIGITAFSAKPVIAGANGSYGVGVGADILIFTYDVATKTITLT